MAKISNLRAHLKALVDAHESDNSDALAAIVADARETLGRKTKDGTIIPEIENEIIPGDDGDSYIHLGDCAYARIDNDDIERIKTLTWRYSKDSYAVSNRSSGRTIAMHRFLINAPKGMLVDHIDGNPLNNRKSNLRLATAVQNQYNRWISKANTSGFRGVSKDKRTGKWRASIRIDGKKIELGLFDDLYKASEKYEEYAKVHHGEFYRSSFHNDAFSSSPQVIAVI